LRKTLLIAEFSEASWERVLDRIHLYDDYTVYVMTCQVRTSATTRLDEIRKLPSWYLEQAAEALVTAKSDLGKRIREARDEKGWVQKQLAAAVHVEPTTISRWECGVHEPDLGKIDLLAEVLGKPVSFFVDEPERRDQLGRIEEQLGSVADELAAVIRLLNERLPKATPRPLPASRQRRRAV
jgi:transcriptional regulator with XRE-family HTH domain